MIAVQKIRYKFAYGKTNWFKGWYYSSTITCYCPFNILPGTRQHRISAFSEALIIIIIANQMFYKKYDQSFKNYEFVKFFTCSPNTSNIFAFIIVFEWGRILKSAMDKNEVKCNAKLRSNYFSLNVSILAIIFCQKISKNRQFQAKLWVFWNLPSK